MLLAVSARLRRLAALAGVLLSLAAGLGAANLACGPNLEIYGGVPNGSSLSGNYAVGCSSTLLIVTLECESCAGPGAISYNGTPMLPLVAHPTAGLKVWTYYLAGNFSGASLPVSITLGASTSAPVAVFAMAFQSVNIACPIGAVSDFSGPSSMSNGTLNATLAISPRSTSSSILQMSYLSQPYKAQMSLDHVNTAPQFTFNNLYGTNFGVFSFGEWGNSGTVPQTLLYTWKEGSTNVASNLLDLQAIELITGSACPPTPTPTFSSSPTVTRTSSPTPSSTPTPSASPSATPSASPSPTLTRTPTASPSASPTASPTATPSASPSASRTATLTATPTATPSASPSASPTATPTASATATPTASATATPTASATATPSASPTATPTVTPTATPTASPTVTRTASATATPSASPTATRTASPSPTSTPTPAMPVLKSADRDTATLGDEIRYCLSYTNDSQASADLELWDSLPAGLGFLSCEGACSFDASRGVVSWSLVGVPAGGQGSVCFKARVLAAP